MKRRLFFILTGLTAGTIACGRLCAPAKACTGYHAGTAAEDAAAGYS
jgi:hypothetical protein